MKRFNRQWWIKLGKRLLYVVAVGWIMMLILEGCYRYQIWDFYRTELVALNPDLDSPKPSILVMGDSFSADTSSWVSDIRRTFPQYKVINSAVPGTGVLQAHLMANRRFKRFQPPIFVYQIYVGNDLFDLRYPTQSRKISRTRKWYWTISNSLRFLPWLNYKSGQWISDPKLSTQTAKTDAAFDPDLFTTREKRYFEAEPEIISNHILLQGGREAEMDQLIKRLNKLLDYCQTGNCQAFIVLIPHCAQVSETYMRNMTRAGARIRERKNIFDVDYPFAHKIAESLEGRPNVHMLNPLLAMQQAENRGQTLYFANDIHLNQQGQRWLGQWISDTLQALLPENNPRKR